MWENCEVFNPDTDTFEIKRLAKGISLEDTALCFGYEYAELPETDQRFLRATHTKGRLENCVEAAEHLFTQMQNSRNGGSLAIQYLQNYSTDWPKEGLAGAGAGLNFKVLLE